MIFFFYLYQKFYFKIISLFLNRRLFLKRKDKKKYIKLEKNPLLRGSSTKVAVITPKKPNSARRPVIKCTLSNSHLLLAHVPGIGHNLRKHSTVLIRGGGARDLPMVNYSCVRSKYDLNGVQNRITRRSIYGVKFDKNLRNKKKFKRL